MKRIAIFILSIVCLLSCQKEEEGLTTTPGLITIDPVITRATDVNFENGDKIGLTITKMDDESTYTENSLLTFTNNTFAGTLEWYSEANDKAQLTAYYPYSESGVPTTFTIATDQTSGYGTSDLMGAIKTDVLPTVNSVSMVFKHMLTKIVVRIDNETEATITSVTLQGSSPTAKVNLSDLSVEADDNQATVDINTQQVTANTTYQAIVVPQTVSFTMVVKTSNNQTLTQKLAETALVQGGQYTVNARVLPGELYVSLSGEIEDWTDEGTIGTGTDPDTDFEEFDGYFIYDGVTYNTVTFSNGATWMTSPLRYIPEGFTPSADPTADSHIWYPYTINGTAVAQTDEASIIAKGYLYNNFLAFGGKEEITDENCYTFEGTQGICPTGWHIPTRADYFDLVGASLRAANESGAPEPNKEAIFYDASYNAGKVSNAIEKGFNYVFSGVRMQSTFAGAISYSANTISGVAEWSGLPSINYYLTSTCYQPSYNSTSGELSNIQFFSMTSSFVTNSPEGKISLAYAGIKCGQQIRCVKDN